MFFLILSAFSAVLLVSLKNSCPVSCSVDQCAQYFVQPISTLITKLFDIAPTNKRNYSLRLRDSGKIISNRSKLYLQSMRFFFYKNPPVTTFRLSSPHNQHNPCNHSVCCLEGKSMFVSSIIISHPLKTIYPTISRFLLVLFLSIYKSKVCKIRLISRLQQLTE